MKIEKLFLIVTFLCVAPTLYAQEPAGTIDPLYTQEVVETRVRTRHVQQRDGGFSIHIGGALPIGRFGQEPTSSYADFLETGRFSAGIGLTAGVKWKFSVSPTGGLGVFISADVISHKAGGVVRAQYDEMRTNAKNDRKEVKVPGYLNIPVFAGLNYRYDYSPKIGIWLECGAGPDIRIISESSKYTKFKGGFVVGEDIRYDYATSEKATFKTKTVFGLQVGMGVILSDRISIGLNCYMLGKAKIEGNLLQEEWRGNSDGGTDYTKTADGPFSYDKKYAQSSMLLRLGYHF